MGPAEIRSTGDTPSVLERYYTGISDMSTENKTETRQSQSQQTPRQASVMANSIAPSVTSDKQDMVCPDPTLHRDTKLQEQASSAALYVTKGAKASDPTKDGTLDANNKLSSRSAAASLKYANPKDLPSYPVVGINTTGSANSAANIANNNQKPFEHWKPDPSTSASAAALAAKDYKMAPLWKPELSSAGSKAALLAHRDGGKLDLWQPQPSADGNSAAGIAMRNNTLSPKLDYGYSDDGRKRALMAATGALGKSQSVKKPAPVNPAYPDSANSAYNALNAATVAHRPSTKSVKAPQSDSNRIDSDAMRAARVQNMGANVPREMFGSTPPVNLEVEEKNKQAALRASAISMAKQMYDQTEKKRKDQEAAEISGRIGTSAATSVHNRAPSNATDSPDLKTQAMQYIHLQEAAQKLAAERLAKMDPDGVARYRSHYGYEPHSPRSRMSLRKKPARGRAESNPKQQQQDEDDSSDDEFRSRRIRHQMANLNDSVNQQDQKRTQDRAALLAAAEKKVQAQMHTMDERVFAETGKVTPAMMEEWEAKARARATADSENRQRNYGKVAIGGGKFMDQSELEAIAQSRLQPTLDEISETAEKKRARDEEIRLDQEERQRQFKSEREKEKDVKAEQKRLKGTEKAEAKNARRMEKDLEKARKAEEKQARKEERQRTKDAKKETAAAASTSAAAHEAKDKETVPSSTTTAVPVTTAVPTTTVPDATADADRDVDADTTPAIEPTGEIADTDGAPLATTDSPDMMTRVETGGSKHSTRSGMRPELDRHITTISTSSSSSAATSLSDTSDEEAGDARPVGVEPTPVTATGETPTRPRSGRFSGIFSRFRSKSKAADTEDLAADHKRSTSTTEPTNTTSTTAAPIVATAAVPVAAATSDTASESSFRRHRTDLHSISSLSSSNEGATRGRTTAAGGVSDVDDEEEEFEEARDNFDETLAPPPSFGGQMKSQSPVRETKFQEEL